jgi:ABC-2 type transport system ATP-binding protein
VSAIISVQGVKKSFRRHQGWSGWLGRSAEKLVLDGITLDIHPGEIFGLLGPNGAGKTTLMKVLSGLLLPDAGRVVVDGHDVASHGDQVRRRIGLVYGDERSFYWRLSVWENLRFYATLYGLRPDAARRRIERLLALLGLREVAQTRMYALSSGLKQRTAIARGLINDPPIILMDEPTRSLDPLGAEELRGLIRERVNEGRTVLLATNQMDEAEALCGRLTLLQAGRTVLTGSVSDFRGRLGQDVLYRLVVSGGKRGWHAGLSGFPGVVSVSFDRVTDLTTQVELTIDRSGSALAIVIRHLVESGAEIRSCTEEEPGLDEVFRELVRSDLRAPQAIRA